MRLVREIAGDMSASLVGRGPERYCSGVSADLVQDGVERRMLPISGKDDLTTVGQHLLYSPALPAMSLPSAPVGQHSSASSTSGSGQHRDLRPTVVPADLAHDLGQLVQQGLGFPPRSDFPAAHGLISTAVRCSIRPYIAALQHKRWRNGPGHRTFPHDEPIPRRAARIREGRPPCLRPLAPSRPPWASPAGAGLCGDRTHGPARDYLARLGVHREFRAVLAEPGSYSDRELSDLGLVLAALAPATRGVVGKP